MLPFSECPRRKFVVLGEGLEPSRLAAPDPKSDVYTDSTIRAGISAAAAHGFVLRYPRLPAVDTRRIEVRNAIVAGRAITATENCVLH